MQPSYGFFSSGCWFPFSFPLQPSTKGSPYFKRKSCSHGKSAPCKRNRSSQNEAKDAFQTGTMKQTCLISPTAPKTSGLSPKAAPSHTGRAFLGLSTPNRLQLLGKKDTPVFQRCCECCAFPTPSAGSGGFGGEVEAQTDPMDDPEDGEFTLTRCFLFCFLFFPRHTKNGRFLCVFALKPQNWVASKKTDPLWCA